MPLTKLEEGKSAKVLSISGEHKVVQRLLDMGFTTDTKITLVRKGAFNGPMEILVRGSRLALGKDIADAILVQEI